MSYIIVDLMNLLNQNIASVISFFSKGNATVFGTTTITTTLWGC
ncbi:hypothetical protein [Yeosuana marina]